MKHTSYSIIALAALALASCQSKDDTTKAPQPDASPALTAVIDADVTGDAQAIHVIRQTAKVGDTITIKGRIMGNDNPFVEGRAAFILGDSEVITACSDRPGDGCETPWDNCCDAPEDIKRGTATIQIINADGRVLKEGVEGIAGIEKLAKLRVTGTVAEGSSPERLVINATAIDLQ